MKLISAIEDKPPLPKPAAPCHVNLGAVRLKAMRRAPEIDPSQFCDGPCGVSASSRPPPQLRWLTRRGANQSVNSDVLVENDDALFVAHDVVAV